MKKFTNQSNPYLFKDSKKIYEGENKCFKLDKLELRGQEITYSYLEKKGGVCIVAMDDEGNVAMVGQWRYPLNKYSWEFPAGGQEEGESIKETAIRELQEEAGIKADEWIHLGSMNPNSSNCSMESHAYLARNLTIGEATPEDDETLELAWYKWEDIVEAALDGTIMEALAIFAVFKVQAYLQNEE